MSYGRERDGHRNKGNSVPKHGERKAQQKKRGKEQRTTRRKGEVTGKEKVKTARLTDKEGANRRKQR